MIKHDPLVIAGRAYGSRLLIGTGKYKDFAQTREAVVASRITSYNVCYTKLLREIVVAVGGG